jgi:copper homeostasis protein
LNYTLEIACFTLNGALAAQKAGAHRIELCENPGEGGTTQSYGTLRLVRKKIGIPVFPIIRPRGGDFLYSNDEFEVMKQDVLLCKTLGYEGVVLGLLNQDGRMDVERTQQLVEVAYPMEVTFHRAFDRCLHPLEALEDVIAAGCQRILTSGQVPNAPDGAELLAQLVTKANDRIIIMPGSGVRANNVYQLAQHTGAVEFHTSARMDVVSNMNFEVQTMNERLTYSGVDTNEVSNIIAELSRFFNSDY